ncbi:MAG: hypothetical protein WCB95_00370, partial [Aeromicrobium sp.]
MDTPSPDREGTRSLGQSRPGGDDVIDHHQGCVGRQPLPIQREGAMQIARPVTGPQSDLIDRATRSPEHRMHRDAVPDCVETRGSCQGQG